MDFIMRTESATSFKEKKTGATKQKVPREGTQLRELWNIFQMHKGEVVILPITVIYPKRCIIDLVDYYGLDIRNFGQTYGKGRGCKASKWILAGEWFGKEYIDYIARNKKKLKKVEKAISNEEHLVHGRSPPRT